MTENAASATSTQVKKRVRFDEDPTPTIKRSTKLQSPKALALSSLHLFCATLQPNLAPIFKSIGTEWIDIVSKHRSTITKAQKMVDDDDFIPRSARKVDFQFYVSTDVENSPEFTAIKEETDAIVVNFRKTCKDQILKVMQVEVRILEARAKTFFVASIAKITKATLISNQNALPTLHKVVNTIMELNHELLLDETGISNSDFNDAYTLQNTLTTFPFPDDPVAGYAQEAHAQDRITAAAPSKINIIATLITPISELLSRERQIEVDISLKKLMTTDEQEAANEATQTRMDVETSIDKELISEMINKATAEKTRTLRSELGQIKKLVKDLGDAKNTRRGQKPKGGASKGTKKVTSAVEGKSAASSHSPSTLKGTKKQAARKAGAQGNASTKKNRKPKPKKGAKKK